jgi:hypothetical protein
MDYEKMGNPQFVFRGTHFSIIDSVAITLLDLTTRMTTHFTYYHWYLLLRYLALIPCPITLD